MCTLIPEKISCQTSLGVGVSKESGPETSFLPARERRTRLQEGSRFWNVRGERFRGWFDVELMNVDKSGHRVIGLVNALGIGEEARVSFVFVAHPLGIDHELFEMGHCFMTSGALSHSHPWHHRTALLAPARL